MVYDIFLESGPKHRKTMVHVLDLPGCVAVGPTTGDAVRATPEAMRRYRRFLVGVGEAVAAGDAIETQTVEHVTDGAWSGNGSPYEKIRRISNRSRTP